MKSTLSLFALFLFVSNLFSQSFSPPEFLSSTPFELRGALLIDLEGDGDLDALAGGVGFNASGIETWENNNGQFTLVTGNIPFGNFGSGILAAADIDMDGDEDFAAVIEETLIWYANDGSGQFGNPTIVDNDMGDVRSIAFGQLDLVAGPEMVVARIDAEDVLAYANDGNGNFGSAITVSSNSQDAIDAVIGDFSGDGLNDIAVACLNGCDVTWHENLGSLTFGPQTILTTALNGSYKLALEDFDENGHLDIAVVAFGSDDLSVFFNSGAGVFAPQTLISDDVDGATNLAVGDFNNDGDVDLCVGIENGNFPILFFGNGSGGFTELIIDDTGSVDNPEQFLAGDVDGDGRIDLVTASQDDNKLVWFKQDPGVITPGTNPFLEQQLINQPASRVNDQASGDIDGDGLNDLITTERTTGQVTWYQNDAVGTLSRRQVLLDLNEGLAGLDVGDIDGDGSTDVIVSNIPDSTVAIYLNQGAGSAFTEIILDQGLDGPYSPYLSDLDNDGDLDVLQASGWDQEVYIYPNLGGGIFGSRIVLCDDCLFSTAIAAEDLNEDGLPEVLVYKGQNQDLEIYENLGGLTFGPAELIVDLVNGCRDIAFLDYDHDGDLDVFSSGIFTNRIRYAENLGNLNFATDVEVPFNVVGVYSFAVLDADLDGDDDLAYADFFSNQIRLILLEDGEFTERRTVDNVFENPLTLLAEDFNGDGAADLTSAFRNYLALYTNEATSCASRRPENLQVSFTAATADFSWDPVPGTEACRITLQSQNAQIIQQNIFGVEPSSFSAPVSALTTGLGYNWRVQCACSLNPIEPTAPSQVSFFVVPVGLTIFPNPAQENLQVQFDSGANPLGMNYRITDLQGRTIKQGIYANQISLNEIEMGYYLLNMDGKVSRFFKN
ncbi:FG-GAP-like repeat-containing protein [Cryomorphaceae bacterium 1068]|nr:FG-GAP-like repeat-containing protein [Cryomorphaceae bacterium 1068]